MPHEDFIVTKMARQDRLTKDEMDAKSILERSGVELDWKYLRSRAEYAQVQGILKLYMTTRSKRIER